MKYIIKDNKIEYLDNRFYHMDGEYYPSVTTILSCYPKDYHFEEWLKNMGRNADLIKDQAATIGSNVHKAIEMFLNGQEITHDAYTIEEWELICKAFDFFDRHKFTDIKTEHNVIRPDLGYGGTIDFIGTYNGVRYMIDFKTSNYMSETMFMQLTAYNRMLNQPCEKIAVLHLRSNTRTEKDFQGRGYKLEFPDQDYNRLFDITHELFKHKHRDLKPKLINYKLKLKLK
jgi:hypothetical protein